MNTNANTPKGDTFRERRHELERLKAEARAYAPELLAQIEALAQAEWISRKDLHLFKRTLIKSRLRRHLTR